MPCANSKCKWCTTSGCRLFLGQSWRRCRKSVPAAKPRTHTAPKAPSLPEK